MAIKVKRASVRWVEGKEFEATTESNHRVTMDTAIQFGGKNQGPTPMELLLLGLGGCTGMNVIGILQKKREAVTSLEIRVEAVHADTSPTIFTDIDLIYIVHGKDVSPKAVEEAIHLSETKYCGASAMLGRAANIKTRFEIIQDPVA